VNVFPVDKSIIVSAPQRQAQTAFLLLRWLSWRCSDIRINFHQEITTYNHWFAGWLMLFGIMARLWQLRYGQIQV
jgi:hypothetical protein